MAGLLEHVRILLLDDDDDTREVIGEGLRRHGAEVFDAASAQTALLIFERERPHVVVADIELPEVDGYAFVRALRQAERERRRTPVIALTVHNTPAERLESLRAGFTLHISKPISPDELAARIATLLDARPE
jgi:CheY-like chemotaxis protein